MLKKRFRLPQKRCDCLLNYQPFLGLHGFGVIAMKGLFILSWVIQVKETFGIGKESSESAGTSAKDGAGAGAEEGTKASPGEEADKQTGTGDTADSFFGKFKSRIPSSNVSSAYQKLKEARVSEMMKKGYDVVKDELYGNTNKRKHLEHTPPPAFSGEISTKTDVVVLPSKQSRWSKKWEAFREKVILLMLH
jgi:import inner membrane translocase subunit TIM44